jgi:hypothetical protein
LKLYPEALKLKADRKTKKPEELIKLDNWWVEIEQEIDLDLGNNVIEPCFVLRCT